MDNEILKDEDVVVLNLVFFNSAPITVLIDFKMACVIESGWIDYMKEMKEKSEEPNYLNENKNKIVSRYFSVMRKNGTKTTFLISQLIGVHFIKYEERHTS